MRCYPWITNGSCQCSNLYELHFHNPTNTRMTMTRAKKSNRTTEPIRAASRCLLKDGTATPVTWTLCCMPSRTSWLVSSVCSCLCRCLILPPWCSSPCSCVPSAKQNYQNLRYSSSCSHAGGISIRSNIYYMEKVRFYSIVLIASQGNTGRSVSGHMPLSISETLKS